jgi:hypothetical protein
MKDFCFVLAAFLIASNAAVCGDESPPDSPLIRQYKRYELPMPPNDGELVRIGKPCASGAIELGIAPQDRDEAVATVLRGTAQLEIGSRELAPQTVVPEDAKVIFTAEGPFSLNAGPAIAIQLEILGRTSESKIIWRLAQRPRAYWRHPLSIIPSYAPNATRTELLAQHAFLHYVNSLAQKNTDRAHVLKLLREIEKDLPRESYSEFILVDTLEDTLAEPGPSASAIERTICGLTDCSSRPFCEPGKSGDVRLTWDAAGKAVLDAGPAAIPSLIDHLDDHRLTRIASWPFNMSPPGLVTVGDVCREILRDYGCNSSEFVRSARSLEFPNAKAIARRWHKESPVYSETRFLTGLLQTSETLSDPIVALAIRHPATFLDALLSDADLIMRYDIALLSALVADLDAPSERKVSLLEKLLDRLPRRDVSWAFAAMKRLDARKFQSRALAAIANLPSTGRPSSDERIGRLSVLAGTCLNSENDDVWDAAFRYTEECDAALRIEIVVKLSEPHLPDQVRKRQISFYRRLIDDDVVRKDLPEGRTDFEAYQPLVVRNAAAMQLLWLLEGKNEPSGKYLKVREDLSNEEWLQLRENAKAAAAKYLSHAGGTTP